MKKIRLLFVLVALIFLTGCSANYEVEIYNNTVNEHIDLVDSTSMDGTENKKNIENLFYKYLDSSDLLYTRNFEIVSDELRNKYSLSEDSSYTIEEYQEELGYVRNCCRSVEISDDKEFINFRTLGYFKWFEKYDELDELTIKVKSNHKVKEHNADKVSGHTYIWYINKMNYKDKIPSLKLYSNKYVFNYNNEFIKKILPIIIIVGIIVIVGGVSYFYLKGKSNAVNQI